jgi:hypothetical protein
MGITPFFGCKWSLILVSIKELVEVVGEG